MKCIAIAAVAALVVGSMGLAGPAPVELASCKGKDPCKVCKDCSRCAYCKNGQKCGACTKPAHHH